MSTPRAVETLTPLSLWMTVWIDRWPPERSTMSVLLPASPRVTFAFDATGCLTISFDGAAHVFGPMAVEDDGRDRSGYASFAVLNDGANVFLRVGDGPPIQPGIPFAIKLSPETEPELSIGHPDARDRCSCWIRERRRLFEPFRTPTNRGMAVTPSHDRQRLSDELSNLQAYVGDIHRGITARFSPLRNSLRALVVAKYDEHEPRRLRRTAVPLLLRLASVGDLPLPVFAPPDLPPSVKAPVEAMRRNEFAVHSIVAPSASVYRRTPVEQIRDFQDVLESELLIMRTLEGRTVQLSTALAISGASEKLGGSHFDTSLPPEIELLHATQLDAVCLSLAEVTVSLGRYVLHELPMHW